MPKEIAPEGGLLWTLVWAVAAGAIAIVVIALYIPFRLAALIAGPRRRARRRVGDPAGAVSEGTSSSPQRCRGT